MHIKIKELNKKIKLKTSAKLFIEDEADEQDEELFKFNLAKNEVSLENSDSE